MYFALKIIIKVPNGNTYLQKPFYVIAQAGDRQCDSDGRKGQKPGNSAMKEWIEIKQSIAIINVAGIVLTVFVFVAGASTGSSNLFEVADTRSPRVKSGFSAPCSGAGMTAATTAYAIAVAHPESLPAFVKANAELFGEDGEAINCFHLLTEKLMKIESQSNASDQIRHKVLNVFDKTNDRLFNEMVTDFFGRIRFQAILIKNLSETLPLLVKGDDIGYVTSEFFFEMIFLNHKWYAALGSDPAGDLRLKLKISAEQFIKTLILYSLK